MERNIIKWHYLTDIQGKPSGNLRGWDDRLKMRFELTCNADKWSVRAVYHRITAFGINPEPTYQFIKSGAIVECMVAAENWASDEYANIEE